MQSNVNHNINNVLIANPLDNLFVDVLNAVTDKLVLLVNIDLCTENIIIEVFERYSRGYLVPAGVVTVPRQQNHLSKSNSTLTELELTLMSASW